MMRFDFENDVLEWTNLAIKRLGYELSGKDKVESRLDYLFNLLRNKIPTVPRKVHIAKHFNCPPKYDTALKQIIFEIESGADLSPRGSRKQNKKIGYYDSMLLDWNIYHLHLGRKIIRSGKNKGLIEGFKEILFVFITDENAYIIGVFDHNSWAKKNVLKVVHDNWPYLLDMYKLKGNISLEKEIKDEDREFFRNNSINCFIEIENDIYMGPGGGITSAGTGLTESRKTNIVMILVDNLKEWLNEYYSNIRNSLKRYINNIDNEYFKLDVSRLVFSGTYSILAIKNRVRIFLPSSPPARSLVHPAHAHIIEPINKNHLYIEPFSSGYFVEYIK